MDTSRLQLLNKKSNTNPMFSVVKKFKRPNNHNEFLKKSTKLRDDLKNYISSLGIINNVNTKEIINNLNIYVSNYFGYTGYYMNDFKKKINKGYWDDFNDASGNIYYRLIIPDLSNNKLDQIYSFYDLSNNKINARTEPNKFNSFVFTKKFDSLFCYGKEVNDFHTLDKQKLFALNFSATQELDRKVIALEKENAELKSELALIKQHLGL